MFPYLHLHVHMLAFTFIIYNKLYIIYCLYDDYPNIQVKDSIVKRRFGANICAKFIYNLHLFNPDVNDTLLKANHSQSQPYTMSQGTEGGALSKIV